MTELRGGAASGGPWIGARDLTWCSSIWSRLDASGHHLTVGARLPTIGIEWLRLNGEATWTARSDRTQGLARPVAVGCAQ
jgi:hypothetical protein